MVIYIESSSKREGFTLLELLVVLILMSLATGLFLGINFRQKESLQARAFATELSQFLRTARSQAMVQGRKNTCRLGKGGAEVQDSLRGKSLAVPGGVRIKLQNPQGDKPLLATFYPDGSLVLEELRLVSEQQSLRPKADLLLGKVEFE